MKPSIKFSDEVLNQRIKPLLTERSQQTVYDTLEHDEKEHIYELLEEGIVNGELPAFFTKGKAALLNEMKNTWLPKLTQVQKEKQEQLDQIKEARQKKETMLNNAILKRFLADFVKTLMKMVFNIPVPAGISVEQAYEKIATHHIELSEKILNPILNSMGITNAADQLRVRRLSWRIFYMENIFGMPSYTLLDNSTILSTAALAAALRYQSHILNIVTEESADDTVRLNLLKRRENIITTISKDQEQNEGVTIEESELLFVEYLPIALDKIFGAIEAQILGL